MSLATLVFSRPRATDGIANVAEGSEVPEMRPRTGKRGTDQELVKLLSIALDNLAYSHCSFWACRGPSKPKDMCTCVKCWAMREVATVRASLAARQAPSPNTPGEDR